MAQRFDSSSSQFYRSRYPRLPVLDKGNFGPPIWGPYQQRWDPNVRQWFRPDGSRASLSGLGDMELPNLDLSANAGATELVDRQTFATIAVALVLGLGGGWALQKHHKMAGFAMLGLGGIAAVTAVMLLKRNADAQAAYAAWQSTPASPPSGMPNSGTIAGVRDWFRGVREW